MNDGKNPRCREERSVHKGRLESLPGKRGNESNGWRCAEEDRDVEIRRRPRKTTQNERLRSAWDRSPKTSATEPCARGIDLALQTDVVFEILRTLSLERSWGKAKKVRTKRICRPHGGAAPFPFVLPSPVGKLCPPDTRPVSLGKGS